MKTPAFLSLVAVLMVSLSTVARAQIVWSTPVGTISGTSDISTWGDPFDALQAMPAGAYGYPKPTETIGNTTFNADSGFYTDGTISYAAGTDSTLNYGPASGSDDFTTSDAYNSVLIGAFNVNDQGSNSNTGVITLGSETTQLATGTEYQVQLWVETPSDSASQTTFADGNSTQVGSGEYVIGTFFATGPTETIDFTGTTADGGSGYGYVNDVALRVIPEPSTYALIGLGALVLMWRLRRKLV